MFRARTLASLFSLAVAGCAAQPHEPTTPPPVAVAPAKLTPIPGAKNVPVWQLMTDRLSGAMPRLRHDSDRMRSHALLFRICADRDGKVIDVTPVSAGTPTELADVTAVLRTWTFQPQPQPVCSVSRFMFAFADARRRGSR